jgi:hypothetical protein
MQRIPFIALAIGLPLLVAAQPSPDTLWTHTYGGSAGDHVLSVQQTADGGYMLAGHTTSFGAGGSDFYLVKTDSQGDTLWTRTYGGSNNDWAYSGMQTADGGYAMAGATESFGAGSGDFYLVKTNSQGDTLWTRTYGGSNYDRANSVQQTTDGGYIVAGWTRSFGAGAEDFYLVKTNTQGDTLWTRTYGASAADVAYSVQQTTDGGYVAAGYTANSTAGGTDFHLVKTNSSGDTLWTFTFGGYLDDCVAAVQQTTDGGYIAGGFTMSMGAGYNDFCLVKIDSSGALLWTRTYGGSLDDFAWAAQQTPDGGYIIAGQMRVSTTWDRAFYLVKADSVGDTLWTRLYGGTGNEGAYAACQTADGGYAVAGYTDSYGAGGDDIYLVKTGPEPPYHATTYFGQSRGDPVLRWVAARTCDYNIYSTTDMSAGEPPTGWTLEVALYNVPAGPVEWTDPAGSVAYKRYAITMTCP